MTIHTTAILGDTVSLGKGVEIGPFAVIESGVHIGDGCRIGPHVVVHSGTELGERCRVHAHAVLGDLPQDTSFEPSVTRVVIGPGCILREGVTIHRGTKPGTATVLGRECLLMANAHVGHNSELGDQVILANGVLLAGYVQVGSGAFLSGNSVVHQFTRVGRLAMLSGGCGVSKDVPPFCLVPGLTPNRISGLNVVGMRRAGMSAAERIEVKRAFALVYRSGKNVRQALAELREAFTEGPASEWAPFIEASSRGICGMVAAG